MAEQKVEAPLLQNADVQDIVSFAKMQGSGEVFIVGTRKYRIKPMTVADAMEFVNESLSIGGQIFNLFSKDRIDTLDKYLSKYVTNEKGEPMTVKKTAEDNWDIVNLKDCIRELADASG